jgi:hypothetical protein
VGDGDDLVDERGRRVGLSSDTNGPAVHGGRAGDGDVATEAHQRAGADDSRHPRCGAVGGQRLRGGAEVEPDATRNTNGPVSCIELDVRVSGDRAKRSGRWSRPGLHRVEVRVIAERGEGVADGGVDGAPGARRRGDRNLEGQVQQSTDADWPTGPVVYPLELGVVSEAATGRVDGLELCGQLPLGGVCRTRVLDDDGGGRPDGAHRPCGQSRVGTGDAGHRDVPPEVTDGLALLMVGAEEFPEDVPVPLVDDEDPATEPVDPFVVLVLPGCSFATTMPMATVAPVAARTAPQVSERNRDVVLSRSRGVFGKWLADMWMGNLSWERPYPIIIDSTRSQGPLWTR